MRNFALEIVYFIVLRFFRAFRMFFRASFEPYNIYRYIAAPLEPRGPQPSQAASRRCKPLTDDPSSIS